ncbi:YdeI/OmpD-associated family protein [Neptuniibacter caesariensis]|uniref:Bacteriocin-protection protein n=1 Tax=Neptuniibacter caesariensis TaxID=207954 RepID=A0A7U8C699_NEPCE|nr:YdeI/OmpD-associated family protein [Neptuniibacter caesariensis]EAR62297.1 hypothetical protein MED92_14708 [Oceanospirillum sp. MED92] [Neptuniibacter caesariensis]
MPDTTTSLSFTTPEALHLWLKANHASESELWIKIFKVKSGMQSVTWDEVVVESLCWGWIDGIKKSVDEHAYLQRITPRKAKSVWSKRNREHAERLIGEGRMMAAGLAQVEAAKADGRWANAYTASEMEVPEDFINALDDYPEAKAFYATLAKSRRYVIAHGLISAKKAETRQRRFVKFIEALARGENP